MKIYKHLTRLYIILGIVLLSTLRPAIAESPTNESPANYSNSSRNLDSAADLVVVDSLLEDGKSTSERHLYEQQQQQQQQQQQANEFIESVASSLSSELINSNPKPEPRNQQDDQISTIDVKSDSQSSSIINDHRPQQTGNGLTELTQLSSLSQDFASAGQQQSGPTTTTQSPLATSMAPATVATMAPMSTPAPIQMNYQQQQHWTSNQNNNNQAASNQVFSIQPHPNSINAIINEQQQQQQPAPQVQVMQQAQQQPSAATSAGPMTMSINGQSQPLPAASISVTMNPNGQALNPQNGRRISNWLKSISSMLANIFNRREHLNLNLLTSASTNSNPSLINHWFNPANQPHWLTQAQNAIQMQQQQFQQQFNPNPLPSAAASTRYATFVQAPQSQQQQQNSQQPTMTITLPASILSNGQQQQQQSAAQRAQASQQSNYQLADLVPSSSSANYIQVQAPSPSQQSNQAGTIQVSLVQQQQPLMRSQVVPTNDKQSGAGQQGGQVSGTGNNGVQQPASQHTNGQQQTRFGRASPMVAASSNLPLAHYSRYGNVAASGGASAPVSSID